MEVFEAIATRRSVRKFTAEPIEQEKLDRVLEAARLSPSARNDQNWHFVVVRDTGIIRRLYDACCEQSQILEAPCVIIACGTWRRVMNCGQPTDTVNLSIAAAYMMLEAHELGLGTCWLGLFDAGKVRSILGIPDDVSVITVMPLGYPAEIPEGRPRKELGEIVSYDAY